MTIIYSAPPNENALCNFPRIYGFTFCSLPVPASTYTHTYTLQKVTKIENIAHNRFWCNRDCL